MADIDKTIRISDDQQEALGAELIEKNKVIAAQNASIQAQKDLALAEGREYQGPEPDPLLTLDDLIQEKWDERAGADVQTRVAAVSRRVAGIYMRGTAETRAAMLADMAKYDTPAPGPGPQTVPRRRKGWIQEEHMQKRQKSEQSSSITATMEDILMAEKALETLSSRRLNMKSAWAVSRMLRVVRDEAKTFRDLDDKNIKELGEDRAPTAMERARGVHGLVTAVKFENRDEYTQRTKDLLDQQVQIPLQAIVLATLKEGCPECGTEHVIDVEPSVIAGLGPLVVEA